MTPRSSTSPASTARTASWRTTPPRSAAGQIGNVVLVTRNAAGQAQHIVANYRPRTTLLHLSCLIGEQLAGTPYGEHFATSAPE